MVVKADQDRVRALLKDTITLLCKNGLTFDNKFCIEAVIGVTVDDNDVFLISMNELIKSEKAIQNEARAERSEDESDVAQSPGSVKDGRTSNHKRKRKRRKHREKSDVKTEGGSDGSSGDTDDSLSAGEDESISQSQARDPEERQGHSSRVGAPLMKQEAEEEEEDEDLVFIKEEPHDPSMWQQQSQDQSMISNIMDTSNSVLGEGDQNFSSLSEMNLVPMGPGDESAMWSQTQMMGAMQQRPYRPRGPRTSTVTSPGADGQPIPGPAGQDTPQIGIPGAYVCQVCGKIFAFELEIMRHQETNHTNPQRIYRFGCPHCSKRFLKLTHLRVHINAKHSDHKMFKCDKCGREFGYKSSMTHHIKTAHNDV